VPHEVLRANHHSTYRMTAVAGINNSTTIHISHRPQANVV
jgi:hypothetical protein